MKKWLLVWGLEVGYLMCWSTWSVEQLLLCSCLNSSVGRASERWSEGPRFNSLFKWHFFTYFLCWLTYIIRLIATLDYILDICQLQCRGFLPLLAVSFWFQRNFSICVYICVNIIVHCLCEKMITCMGSGSWVPYVCWSTWSVEQLLLCSCLNSSVGRASERWSEGPRFNSLFKWHFFTYFLCWFNLYN